MTQLVKDHAAWDEWAFWYASVWFNHNDLQMCLFNTGDL